LGIIYLATRKETPFCPDFKVGTRSGISVTNDCKKQCSSGDKKCMDACYDSYYDSYSKAGPYSPYGEFSKAGTGTYTCPAAQPDSCDTACANYGDSGYNPTTCSQCINNCSTNYVLLGGKCQLGLSTCVGTARQNAGCNGENICTINGT
jgi:hypothetical protein